MSVVAIVQPLITALEPATAELQKRYPAQLASFEAVDLLSVGFAFFYLLVIFSGQLFMRSRQGFTGKESIFRLVFVVWNALLAAYSIWATYVGARCVAGGVEKLGAEKMVQEGAWEDSDALDSCRQWGYVYAVTKGLEFVDTLFLVVKKSKIRTLHWLHHFLTYLVVYKWLRETDGSDGLCVTLALANTIVHSFMYTYYGLKTLGWNPPEFVPQGITTIQITQMIYLNLGINYGYWVVPVVSFMVYSTYFAMVFLYLILFTRMYVKRYVLGTDHKSAKKHKKKSQ